MPSKRTLDERIREKDAQWQKALEKAKQYENQKKQLARRKNAEERKMRNHRLIEIGACAESVLGRPFAEGDNVRFLNFLKQQERNGNYFTKAMARPLPPEENDSSGKSAAPLPEAAGGADANGETE